MPATSSYSLSYEALSSRFWVSALQVLGASLFIALCAQIYIPLYFSPVWITGQTFAIMLVGATLGSRKGLLSVMAYLVEGSLGLPVFAGAHFGLASLLGPNGGYFIGFMLQAYLVGWCIERQSSVNALRTFAVLLLSCCLQLGIGALWLSHYVGLEYAFMLGVAPFVFGETLKALCVATALKYQRR